MSEPTDAAASPAVVMGDDGVPRCTWGSGDAEYRRYHDEEWGRPLHGDRPLFEKICLEGFQAGLSWITVLRKRDRFRTVFHDFDIETVAEMGEADVERLALDSGIIRNRAKIRATIGNARAARALIGGEGAGALDRLVWSAGPLRPRSHAPRTVADVPAATPESTALSSTLRAKGFAFVGPTTMYALMQSSGVVDDHFRGCHRARADPTDRPQTSGITRSSSRGFSDDSESS